MERDDFDTITLHLAIPRLLRRDLKIEAARRGISLRLLAEEALRALLAAQERGHAEGGR